MSLAMNIPSHGKDGLYDRATDSLSNAVSNDYAKQFLKSFVRRNKVYRVIFALFGDGWPLA